MAKKPSRIGSLWIKQSLPDDDAFTPADLDALWQRAYGDALAAGRDDPMAHRIADDVVHQLKARDNEVA